MLYYVFKILAEIFCYKCIFSVTFFLLSIFFVAYVVLFSPFNVCAIYFLLFITDLFCISSTSYLQEILRLENSQNRFVSLLGFHNTESLFYSNARERHFQNMCSVCVILCIFLSPLSKHQTGSVMPSLTQASSPQYMHSQL